MKKLVLVICALLCANMLFAQENLKEKDLETVVDSLSAKLKELQHNYNYLYCQHLLDDLNHSQNQTKNNILICINQLQINIHHGIYNYYSYNTFKDIYNAAIANFDATKKLSKSILNLVALKMITSNFSEDELRVLQHGILSFDDSIISVEECLRVYDFYIKEYKNMFLQ